MRRLFIRPGAIGDCILTLPAMECLQAGYTEIWVPSPVIPLVRFGDAVHSIASTGIDVVGVIEPPSSLWQRLASFDSIVSWYGSKRPEFRDAVAGYPFEFHELPPEGEYAVDFFLRQVGCRAGTAPRIETPPFERTFTMIHPLSSSPVKSWPRENFEELGTLLGATGPMEWCVNPDGSPRVQNLYDLACWMAQARLYVGNDSGTTHLAAAVGTPVIAIFETTDPLVWAPRGSQVRVFTRPGVDEVYDACVRLLSDA